MVHFKDWCKAIIFSLVWLLAFIGIQLVCLIVAFIFKIFTDSNYIMLLQEAINSASGNINTLINVYIEIMGSLTSYLEVFMLIVIIAFIILDRRIHPKRFMLNKVSIDKIPMLISIGIFLNLTVTFIVNMIGSDILENTGYTETTSLLMQGGFVGVLIGIGICAPICEELVFRYFIFHNGMRVNNILGIMMSSILFGVVHGNIIQGAYAIYFGIIFCIINIKYNSILPSIIIHITINSLSVAMMSIESISMQYVVFIIIFVISLIPTGLCMYLKSKRKVQE